MRIKHLRLFSFKPCFHSFLVLIILISFKYSRDLFLYFSYTTIRLINISLLKSHAVYQYKFIVDLKKLSYRYTILQHVLHTIWAFYSSTEECQACLFQDSLKGFKPLFQCLRLKSKYDQANDDHKDIQSKIQSFLYCKWIPYDCKDDAHMDSQLLFNVSFKNWHSLDLLLKCNLAWYLLLLSLD